MSGKRLQQARQRISGFYHSLDAVDQRVLWGVVGFALLLVVATVTGVMQLGFVLPTLALTGMWVLLALGLNVQWGYAGLINFSVAAFWGIGMYSVALLATPESPIGLSLGPGVAFIAAIVLSALVAVIIGIPTLRLRADYLAIASLGLAEIIRLLVKNQEGITAGTQGVSIQPLLPEAVAVIEGVIGAFDSVFAWDAVAFPYRSLTDLLLVSVAVLAVYLLLRRMHRSPWGRVLRTVRADEELAEALGKNAYALKMQAFVLGSVLMGIAGFFYAYQFLYVSPSELEPINTFYVWVAVILGGTGSNRGAVFGGLTVVLVREGPRFVNDAGLLPVDPAAFRLLLVGLLIVLIVRFRSEGILPPRAELIWPAARETSSDGATTGGDVS